MVIVFRIKTYGLTETEDEVVDDDDSSADDIGDQQDDESSAGVARQAGAAVKETGEQSKQGKNHGCDKVDE